MENFFNRELPEYLKQLSEESRPLWGSMNVYQMLDHLRQGVDLSLDPAERELLIPEEKVPSYQQFLLSDRPFKRSATKPKEYALYAKEGEIENLEQLKVDLLAAVLRMQVFFEKNPDFASIHPYFGLLDGNLWMHLHKKHFKHHLSQFGLFEFA